MVLEKLDIQPDSVFETYEEANKAGVTEPLRSDLLIRVDGEGRIEDQFRLAFRGKGLLKADFRASKFLPHACFHPFVFRLEKPPAAVRLRPNTLSSRWEDLEALVAGGGLQVVDAQGKDAVTAFREAWEGTRASTCPAAAAIRWTVQASPAYGFRLILQGLPRTANFTRKDSRLSCDNGKGIELAGWTAPTSMADGKEWKGPCPVLFAVDPRATKERIKENPGRMKTGKIHMKIFCEKV